VTAALPATPEWTTTSYDALSRVTQVTTPDGSQVNTSYLGNTVTVTDQAGKNRKSETDALGRLTKVWENPTGLNYLTSYSYDELDNLTTVTQGAQTRSFVYNSYKQLKQATNPESGTTSYSYDNNGNLLTKTDARGWITTYGYDALNRNTTVDYTGQGYTHFARFYYDGTTNGKGRLDVGHLVSTQSGTTTQEWFQILNYDVLGRAGLRRQQMYRAGAWSALYNTARTYDLVGNVKSQTYPSGRVVNYDYNNAGQMATFTGNLGDGVNRVYASEMAYNAAGQMTKEAWGKPVAGYGGMTTPLYHNKHYNNRQQMYDIRLGTNGADEWTWNRGALRMFYDSNYAYGNGGTNNNGNVYRLDHFVPTNDSASEWAMSLDYYQYDELNRITAVLENKQAHNLGETATGLTQQYLYDRYGNRTVNNAVSNFPGVFNAPFTVDQTTNRLLAPNGTLSYDAVGNQVNDGYSGAGARTYDVNNKLVSATATGGGTVSYLYDASGSRVSKTVGSTTTWYIYGLGGELVAEYPANGAVGAPQKEYQ
jgi:YD repeat-containing protein